MFRTKMALMALAAVLAVSAVSVTPAMAFTNFVSKAGQGKIKGKALTENKFKVEAGEVACKTAEANGTVKAEKGATQEVEFKYPTGSCVAFGVVPTEITNERYTFNANGEVTLNNEVKVVAKIGGSECKTVVPAGQKFSGAVTYTNNAEKTKIKGNAIISSAIKYTSANCAFGGNGTFSTGSYEGEEELEGNKPPARIYVE
jgi:hypothetical protein